jgi:hypothetical protein
MSIKDRSRQWPSSIASSRTRMRAAVSHGSYDEALPAFFVKEAGKAPRVQIAP